MTFNITNGININKPIIMNNNSITGMSNIYTKQEIDNLLSNKAGTSELSSKQNVLTSKDPLQAIPVGQGLPSLKNNSILDLAIADTSPLTLTYYTDEYIEIGLNPAGNFTRDKGTFNTLAVTGSSVISGEIIVETFNTYK